jgi:hypothetical protein
VSGRHSNENPPDEGGDYERLDPSSGDSHDWFAPRREGPAPHGPAHHPPANGPAQNVPPNLPPVPPSTPNYPPLNTPPGPPPPVPPSASEANGSSDWFSPRTPQAPNLGGTPGDPSIPLGAPTPDQSDPFASSYRAPSGFTGASDPGGYNPGYGSGYGGAGGFSGASDPGGYGYPSYQSSTGSSGTTAPPRESPGSFTDPYGPGGGGPGGPGGPGDWGDPDGAARRRAARRRRSISALIGPLAGAIGLAILLGVGVYALADSGGGCGGGDATELNIAAAPDIAPVVSDIVTRFNDEKHSAGDGCVKGLVKAVEPSSVATLLSGQGSGQGITKPDVWIPDSKLWPTVVQSSPKGADKVSLSPTRLAQSPLVVAMPRSLAARLKSQGVIANPSWDNLLGAAGAFAGGAVTKNQTIPPNLVRIQILDPSQNSAGMETLVLTRLLLTNDPNADTIFAAMVRSVRDNTSPNTKALFASFERDGAGRYPVLLTSEQSVWKYNQTQPSDPAVAVYPVEGTMTMEYPYALTTTDSRKVQAANVLEQAFNSENAKAAVQALGFRTPDGKAGNNFGANFGVSPRRPRALPAPRSQDVQAAMSSWTKLTLGTRMLSLVDVSGSMAEKVPGSNVTRMQGILGVIQGGLSLYPDDTEIGQWLFSTNLKGKQDWVETIPIGPLGERIGSFTRRKQLLAANARIRPKPNGDTGLNDSVAAAYKVMGKGYEPDKYNWVIVFTDGKNDDPEGGLSDGQLIAQLKKEFDPNKPVQIVMIGFGDGVDRAAMERIAQATNGIAFVAQKPQDVARFFLEAIARRACAPNCPTS